MFFTRLTKNIFAELKTPRAKLNICNATGAVTKTYDYDAFSNEKNIDANDTNPMRYCGEYFDKETSMIYLRARYYDARIGRFISEDRYRGNASDPLSLNLYTYCTNNPVRFVDPSGYDPATRKVGIGAMTYYTFVPDVRLSNALVAAGGVVPFGSTIVQGVSDLLSGTQTISDSDLYSIITSSSSDLLDVFSMAENASDALNNIKMFSKFSKALTLYTIYEEMTNKSADINQIIKIMYGDVLWAKTRENLIAKYLKFFDLVDTYVKDGAVTYNTDLAGYVTDLNIDEEKVNKIISDKHIDFESIQKQFD